MLKREGLVATRKRKRRAYARLGLQVRTKRRRRPRRPRVRMIAPTRPNERWPTGFMSGQLASGRRLRIPDVVVDFSKPRVSQLGGHLDHRGPAGALPGRAGQGRRPRQRPRVDQQGDALLERAVWRGAELHPARQAHPERFRGGLQRQVPGQLPEPALVQGPR